MPAFNKIAGIIIFILLGILDQDLCYSQVLVDTKDQKENIFIARTKQFNEFVDRFNYKTDFKGDPVDSVFKSKISRDKFISSLFDLKDNRTDPAGSDFLQNYTDNKKEFIAHVLMNNLLIYKYSENIIAEAKSKIIFKGVPTTISIFLAQEIVGRDMVKWVIEDVKGDLFNFLLPDTTMVRFIPPSSNETDFLNLKRALEDVNYLQYFASKDYDPDYLTLFFYMINSGLVRFEYVESVTYHILDIPGWCIKVNDFNRNELNSGWLISDISRNNSNKLTYLKSLK